jgi:hypothetical protein
MQTSLSLTQAVPIAAAVAAGIIGHALFVRAPVSGARSSFDGTDTRQNVRLQNAD